MATGAMGTMGADSMATMAGMNHDSVGGMNRGGMANMTGDPDRDFFRMMTDHHKGLVAMAHLSVEGDKKGSRSSSERHHHADLHALHPGGCGNESCGHDDHQRTDRHLDARRSP